MVRHICMFQLKEEEKEKNIKEALERAQFLKEIPYIKKFEVVTNSSKAPQNNYDLSLIFDFESIEDLNEYQKHPNHLAFGKFITSVRENRACIDYEF